MAGHVIHASRACQHPGTYPLRRLAPGLVVVQIGLHIAVREDERQGLVEVGHAVQDAHVAVRHGSAAELQKGQEVEEALEDGDPSGRRRGAEHSLRADEGREGAGAAFALMAPKDIPAVAVGKADVGIEAPARAHGHLAAVGGEYLPGNAAGGGVLD